MRIWYLGYYLDWYPRNRVIRRGLAKAGAEVLELKVSPEKLRRYPHLFFKALLAKTPEVIIIPECDLESFPAGLFWARSLGALLVYDAFYSRWDALVNDELEVTKDSAKARFIRRLEQFALQHSDLILADTQAHAEYISEIYGISPAKFETVYIGADDELFHPMPGLEEPFFLVHYNGFYHRLQGAPSIIEAAHYLRGVPEIKFEMVGRRESSSFKTVMAKLEELNPGNIEFIDTVPITEMPARMARASVCLGIFGNTGFGERVFPNKGFQTLAMGIALITRDSKGSREVGVNGEHFLAVPAEDGRALADAIMFLKAHPEKRRMIAENGRRLYEERFSPEKIGEKLLKRLKQEVEGHG